MKSVREFEKSNKFHLISSNRLENLTADLTGRMNNSCGNSILTPEKVIVQSRGMERYLRLGIAEAQGISANIDFPFPQKFVSEYLFKPLLNGKKDNPLDLGVFSWNIFKVLPEMVRDDEDFKQLRSYLADDPSKLKTFQLSQRLANIFEQYVVFRPDVVRKWSFGDNPLKNNPHAVWQSKLWHKVVPYYNGFHFADLYWHFLKHTYPDVYGESNLDKPDFSELKKLKRIFLFGFSAMAPIFLDIFIGVSRYIDVYFYYLNPSEAEWQYNLSERTRLHMTIKSTLVEKADFQFDEDMEYGNALLTSLGKQGREFFALLGSTNEEPEVLFDECKTENILQRIQCDIQLNETGETVDVVLEADRSVQVHSCHTPMREVEVLFENLTAMFQNDSTLLPKDILVLTSNIEVYAPYIEAVFKNDPQRFFTTLADRSQGGISQETETFLNILKITRSRFKASEVMAVLETPAVAEAFELDESMVAIVRQWVIDAGISWGIDGDFRKDAVGIGYNEKSWKQGIERILAGFSFGSVAEDNDRMFAVKDGEILPFYCCEGSSAILFGKLVDFLESLFALRVQINIDEELDEEAFSVDWWDKVLNNVIDKFFPGKDDFARTVSLLRDAVKTTLDAVYNSEYEGHISFEIIYNELSTFFEKSIVSGGFLRGGITFCEARPLRSIPARVLCLLGMDEKSFPRKEKHLSFDLMASKKRLGDRSARKDDRYLFLEALLSARDCFYVSYVGQGVKDNEPRLPSVVLCELLDYIVENYSIPREKLITEHPLQAFSWKYFIDNTDLISYSEENAKLARLRFTQPSGNDFVDSELSEISDELYRIDIDELCDFFVNPSKYFLRKCLEVNPQIRDIAELSDVESFEIEHGLERYKLAESIIRKYLPEWNKRDKGEIKEEIRRRFHAEGVLPLKSWGDIEFEKFFEEFIPFAEKVSGQITTPAEKVSGECSFENGVTVQAEFDDIYEVDGEKMQVQFKYSKLRAKHLIRTSLYELAAKAMGVIQDGESKLICRDREKSLCADEDAQKRLNDLTEIYLEGLRRPLPFFPETSLAYTKNNDINAALKKWESDDYHIGDSEDPYINCCFGNKFKVTDKFAKISKELVKLLGLQ